MPSEPPLDPALLDRLTAYAAAPRGNRDGRTWTVAELVPLFDPAVPARAIAERLGVPRAVVTYEMVRVRRTGFPVPMRPSGGERSSRTLAIEGDLRTGLTDAVVAREPGADPGNPYPGRRVRAVDLMRSILIAEGRIRPKRSRHRRPAE